MIQRIQTLFLLAAAGLTLSMAFCNMSITPVSTLADGTLEQTALRYVNDITSISLILMSFALTMVTIFNYRNRIRQIRLCNINSILLLGFQTYLAFKFFGRPEGHFFTLTAVFPIVSAILCFTAMRYVARDEALVMSASRLRSRHRK